jgi:hypothetical protein
MHAPFFACAGSSLKLDQSREYLLPACPAEPLRHEASSFSEDTFTLSVGAASSKRTLP